MAMFIWLDKERAINLDHVVQVDFWTRTQYEQDGRLSWDPDEDFDICRPMTEVQNELVAEVSFNAVIKQELYSGYETVLEKRNYYGQNARRIQDTLQEKSL